MTSAPKQETSRHFFNGLLLRVDELLALFFSPFFSSTCSSSRLVSWPEGSIGGLREVVVIVAERGKKPGFQKLAKGREKSCLKLFSSIRQRSLLQERDGRTRQQHSPTGPFSILELQARNIGGFHVVQEHRSTDFEASKLWKGWSEGSLLPGAAPTRKGIHRLRAKKERESANLVQQSYYVLARFFFCLIRGRSNARSVSVKAFLCLG